MKTLVGAVAWPLYWIPCHTKDDMALSYLMLKNCRKLFPEQSRGGVGEVAKFDALLLPLEVMACAIRRGR